MERERFLFAALVLFTQGCAPRSMVRPDIHQEGWLLVETRHIALRTNLDRDEAVERAISLERYWEALAHTYGLVAPGRAAPRGPFHVIEFDSCHDITRIGVSRGRGGFVLTRSKLMDESIAVTCEGEADSTFLHELAHIFNGHYFRGMPTWVDEGLATYYETLAVEKGKAVIGGFPSGFSSTWKRPAWLPDLDAIRRMNGERFHEESAEHGNYFCAWKLVHLLNGTGPDREQRFRRYLAGLALAVDSEEAWVQAFADLPGESLANDYRTYHQRRLLTLRTISYEWSNPPPPGVRPLRAGEVHVLWINLLDSDDKVAEAAEQLERLTEVDPDWPELLYWRAVILHPPDAIALLRDYLRRRPGDGRAWRSLVDIQLDRALSPEYLGLEGPPPPALVAMQRDVVQLVEHATDPTSLNAVAWYFAMRQNAVTGLNFAIRALQAAPRCGACWDTAGLLYFQAGKIDQALAAQERAAGLYGEGRMPPDVRARLHRYRAAAAARKKAVMPSGVR